MTKRHFLLFICNILAWPLIGHAQVLNGSFTEGTDGLADWYTAGTPTTTDSTSLSGTYADISSTNGPGGDVQASAAASAADISAALENVALPPTDDIYNALDGEAIYQTVTLSTTEYLTFDYAYSTYDYYPDDSVGYVIDGQYIELVRTPPTEDPTPTAFSALPADTIELGPGDHQIAFVSYNTGDDTTSTHLYITDVELTEVPEPTISFLLGLAAALLGASRLLPRWRAAVCA